VDVLLRPAEPTDLPVVGALHHRSRAAAYRDIVPADALASISGAALASWWIERWPHERDSHLLTVAERDHRIAGFSYLGPDEDSAPGVGELYAIHLDPAEQGRGVGKALMVDALAKLHQQGWRRAVLWVLADNAHARRFYERGGWTPDGAARDEAIGQALIPQLRYARSLAAGVAEPSTGMPGARTSHGTPTPAGEHTISWK